MGTTPTNSHPLQLEKSRPISRIQNPSIFISESSTVLGLPQELITEILLRLPVISLLKFKCVSKPWLSLISSPNFIRHHFSKSCMEGEYLNHQLLFTILDPAPGMKQCCLYSALHEAEPSTHVFDIEYPSPSHNPDYLLRIVGIVNGLVCLAMGPNDDLFIWNPVLRKSKYLPAGWNDNLGTRLKCINYGFGYDESNDDYKVVSLLTVIGSEDTNEAEVRVYSLRADSWKRIEDLKVFIPLNEDGIYANGKMYWSAFDRGDLIQNKKIVRHDMVTEKYEELRQPDYVAGYFDLKLGVVLGGRPFVLFDYYGTKADLWVIDKYGVEESWHKLLSIPYDDGYLSMPYSYQQVVCILSNGEIVFAKEFGFLVYNSKHRESRKIQLDVGSSSNFKVDTYVDSLLWPYG